MASLKRLQKISGTFFFFLIHSCLIFLLSTIYYNEKVPAYKSYSKKEINITSNCSIPPKETLPDHSRTVQMISSNHSRTVQMMSSNHSRTVQMMSSNQSLLIILVWTWPSGHIFPLNQCPASVDSSGCFFTLNRSMYSMANAVVIHHRDVSRSKSLLPLVPRPSYQYWIWFSQESPSNLRNLTIMDNIINMTMSYRVDSDIFTPYGWLEKHEEKENFTIPQKTRLVAWVISNWKRNQRRFHYYQELMQHIKIDLYGKWHFPLPRNLHLQTLSKYKFYLAFENSIHEDYITEKLWSNSFLAGTVPVVMGPSRKNYERFIPPDSFIHVDDFSSAQELASYLLSLDKDDQKYQEYFKWRSSYQPVKPRKTWVTEYCKVCKALKEAPLYRTIPSIAKWFK